MSDYKSHSSTAQDDNITEDMAPEPIEEHTNPKKKNILIRIYQNPRSKILLAVFALLMLGVGAAAVRQVQNYKAAADGPGDYLSRCYANCSDDFPSGSSIKHMCQNNCRANAIRLYRRDNGVPPPLQFGNNTRDALSYAAYLDYLNRTGQQDTPTTRSQFFGSGNSAAAEEARVRAEWQRAYAYALEVKKQQEYRDAAAYARACQAAQSIKPTLTWLSSQGGRSFILPGEKKIKFQVGAGQDGAIIFIDDKANPWSGSCNDLKTGDQCLVPDGKGVNKHADGTRITKEQVGAAGKTQTTYSGFEDGHSYRVWLQGASCGKLSPDSNKLDITVAANDLSGTPAVSTTPAVSPTGTNTQQQGHL